MSPRKVALGLTLLVPLFTLAVTLSVMGAWGSEPPRAAAQSSIRYAAPSGTDADNDCSSNDNPCATIQRAVDVADAGDEIRVATFDVALGLPPLTTTARYTGTAANVVLLTKSVTLRGGYVYAHSAAPPTNLWVPGLIPALVDGEHARRPLYASGDVTPTLELLALVNGHADRGGNVYVEDARLSFIATPVLSGTALYGGGLYLKNCQVSFDPGDLSWEDLLGISGLLLVRHNSAQYGGGLYVEGGAPVLVGLAVYSNTAVYEGGGFYLQGGEPIIAAGIVLENRAGNQGGGFFLQDSAARIVETAVYSNSAADGGGLYLDGPLTLDPTAVPILANNYVRHNRATGGYGGGLYFRQAIAGLVNNVVADNQAPDGAGLYLWASSPRLFHNTIARNGSALLTPGDGGDGIHLTHRPGSVWPPLPPVPSLPAFTNTIVVSHDVGLYVDSTGLPYPLQNRATLDGTLWWGNGTDVTGPGEALRSHDVTGDPRFTCTGGWPGCLNPYHILTDSAALDAGVDLTLLLPGTDLLVDIDGQLRPAGQGYDVGADEVLSDTFSVWFVPPFSLLSAAPGQTVTHTHWLLNSGSQTDTFDLTFTSDPGWAALLGATSITLSPQSSVTVQVRATVPGTATSDLRETSRLTATSRTDSNRRAWAWDVTLVITGAQTDLAVAKWAGEEVVKPGEAVRYTLVVTNAGPHSAPLTVTLADTVVPTAAVTDIDVPPGCTSDTARALLTCSLTLPQGTLPVTTSLALLVTTTDTYSGWLINSALVRADDVLDLRPGNNVAWETVLVTTCLGLQGVTIDGPSRGISGTSSTFAALPVPAPATPPITYTWSPTPALGQGGARAVYTWTATGLQTLTVVARNCGNVVSAEHAISVEFGAQRLYLPLMLRDW